MTMAKASARKKPVTLSFGNAGTDGRKFGSVNWAPTRRKAIALRHKQNLMKMPERYNNEKWKRLVDEETELILWFSDILEEGRSIFSKFLKI